MGDCWDEGLILSIQSVSQSLLDAQLGGKPGRQDGQAVVENVTACIQKMISIKYKIIHSLKLNSDKLI